MTGRREGEQSAAEHTEPGVELRGVTVSYDRDPVVVNVSARLESGRLVGIVGPNGAGKSTLLKAILGLLSRDAGVVRVLGASVDERRGDIVYVPQRSAVDWDFPVTVRDVVMMGRYGRMRWWSRPSRKDREAVSEALEQLGISDLADRHISDLSGGQQQRTFLARAVAQGGEVWLLDEPFVGVDAATESAIIETLQRLRDDGCCVLVVHHDLSTVRDMFDDLLLLNRELVAVGPVSEVFTASNLRATYGGRLAMLDGEGASMAVVDG